MKIYITNLFDLTEHVRAVRPGYLVSIIQPVFQPETPDEIEAERHHRVEVHDISAPSMGSIMPERTHIEELIGFLHDWPADEPLMVHCYAGVSRSSATALIAHYLQGRDEFASAQALRGAAPHASPNRLIISLADEILGCNGRLIEARESMGVSQPVIEGPLVELDAP